jgi:hypothetical protein
VREYLHLDRLILGLELLQGASGAGVNGECERLRGEVETFLKAMDALEFQFPLFRKLHRDSRSLAILTHQIPKNENNELLMTAVQQGMNTVGQDLRFLRERLGQDP